MEAEEQGIEVDGKLIKAEFIQKPVKNSYLRFDDDKLVVVSRNQRTMQKVVSQHMPWISKHYREIQSTTRLFDRGSVFYRSRRYNVKHVKYDSRPKADILDDTLLIYARDEISAERLIDRMTREDTMRVVGSIAESRADAIGASFRELRVRRYRKWGACKRDGTITINYCVSMLPQELQDYIISHEVAHLRHMNHSKSFWKTVYSICPDYKALRKQLKTYDNRRRATVVEGS